MQSSQSPLKTTRSKVIVAIAGLLLLGAAIGFYAGLYDAHASRLSKDTGSAILKRDTTAAMQPHTNVTATVFWVGEPASPDNDYIQNVSSAWQEDWKSHYGGFDDPDNRCGHKPCGFEPKENPFYFALPYNDYLANGQARPASQLQVIPWYGGQPAQGSSLLKNRWIAVTRDGRTVYAQWQDVGPFGEGDVEYVFGTAQPMESRAGLDLSPAAAGYLGFGGSQGRGVVDWRFVEESDVPAGPWKEVVTTSQLAF